MFYSACGRSVTRGVPKQQNSWKRCSERLYCGVPAIPQNPPIYRHFGNNKKNLGFATIYGSQTFGVRNFGTRALSEIVGSIERRKEKDESTKKNKLTTSSKSRSNIPTTAVRSTTALRKPGRLATVIEPTVRGKPFPKREKPHTRRIFVDNSSPRDDTMTTRIAIASSGSYPVIAIQVAQSIDLSRITSEVFCHKGIRKMRERLSVVAQLNHNTSGATQFVAVFRFGSVVFFNVSPKDINSLVEEIKAISTGSLDKERKDRFCVHVQSPTDVVDEVTADYCIVPELNMKSVDVISNVMAQSVALDAYNDTVDQLLADFERINHKVTLEGNTSAINRDRLFRAVAQNNAIFLKLTKVGIKDRVDTAWNLSQYESVSEGMRDEFDIDRRFEHIEFKLNLVQENAKFFLEVLANQKSNSLEWIIIVLILLECVLMCIEMSGMGEPLFAYMGQFMP